MAKVTKISANLKRTNFKQLFTEHEARPLRVNDSIIGGFHLYISKTGAAVWNLEKRISRVKGSAVTFRLGKAWGGKPTETALNALQAAKKAHIYSALCEAGKDPRRELEDDGAVLRLDERQRDKVSFAMLADHYLSNREHSPKWRQDVEYDMKNHLIPWLGKRSDISTLDDEEVLNAYVRFREKGTGMATNLMKTLSAMWNYGKPHFKGADGKRLLGDNPVAAAKRRRGKGGWNVNPNPNKPVITIGQVGGFIAHLEGRIKALKDKKGPAAHNERAGCYALLLCLFAGLRINEATNLLWAGVDMEAGTISVGLIRDNENKPIEGGTQTKNRVNHTVLMSSYVRALMETLAAIRKNISRYVFPMATDNNRPLKYPITLQRKLREATGIYFATHAMRRTFRGVCRTLGIDPDDVGRMLNHRHVGSVTDGYDTGAFNPDMARENWQRVACFLEMKRDFETGQTNALKEKAADLTAWLGTQGLTLRDGAAIIAYLQGQQPTDGAFADAR